MATQTQNASPRPITRPGAARTGRIDRTGGNKSMWTFLLLLAAVIAAVIALAWAF